MSTRQISSVPWAPQMPQVIPGVYHLASSDGGVLTVHPMQSQ